MWRTQMTLLSGLPRRGHIVNVTYPFLRVVCDGEVIERLHAAVEERALIALMTRTRSADFWRSQP
jgi:hypothetical protein